MNRFVLIIFYIEIGLVLAVSPWSHFWDRNYFSDAIPLLHAITTNDFVRGAISGLGLVNLAVAFADLRSLLFARRSNDQLLSIHQPSAED